MVSINPIGKKFVSSINKRFAPKKMSLPQDVTLVPVNIKSSKATKAKSALAQCGGIEAFCTPLISF